MSRLARLQDCIQPAAALVPMALASILAIWGLGFGLPYVFRPDEEVMVGRSVRMVVERSLDPLFYNYPPLAFYLFAAGEAVAGLLGHPLGRASELDPSATYLAARTVSSAALVASTGFVYMAGKSIGGRASGFLSATCLAVAPLAVRQAHFATPDSLAMALVASALWTGQRAGSRRAFLLSGVLCGLAAATKYPAGLVAVFPIVMASHEEDRRGRMLSVLAGSCLALGAVFALAGQPLHYLQGLAFLAGRARAPYGDLPIGLLHHPTQSLPFGLGLGTYGLSLAGVLVALLRRQRTDIALICFLLAYLAAVSFSHEVFYRYVLPMLPALCLVAGSLVQLMPAYGRRRALVLAGCLALILPSAHASVATDRLLSTKDTRQQAAEWLLGNAPAGSAVHVSSYWGQPFYGASQRPPYATGDRLVDSFQQGRFTDRFDVGGAGSPCFMLVESGPPWQAPVPHTDPPPAAVFQPYIGPPPRDSVYDPIDSFYLPISGFAGIQRPGPSIAITKC
jgi:hypothetical protein